MRLKIFNIIFIICFVFLMKEVIMWTDDGMIWMILTFIALALVLYERFRLESKSKKDRLMEKEGTE